MNNDIVKRLEAMENEIVKRLGAVENELVKRLEAWGEMESEDIGGRGE